jgi:hypothetical protein
VPWPWHLVSPPADGRGILVGGVPIGDAKYVDTILDRIAEETG